MYNLKHKKSLIRITFAFASFESLKYMINWLFQYAELTYIYSMNLCTFCALHNAMGDS